MNDGQVSLVFIVEIFPPNPGRVSAYIQRGSPSKRLGPFVSPKEQQTLVARLHEEDRNLLELMQNKGIVAGRDIDPRFEYLPEIAKAIAQHKHLFVRTIRHGSIRKASEDERNALLRRVNHNTAAPIGRILRGELEITEEGRLRLFWIYDDALHSIPYISLTGETTAIELRSGLVVKRNVKAENDLLKELSTAFEISHQVALKGDLDGLDLSRLTRLPKERWGITYKGRVVAPREALFDNSGIAWFSSEGNHDGCQEALDYSLIAEAYLRGRGRIEVDGKLVFLPATSSQGFTDEVALRVATAGSPNVPFASIAQVRKSFDDNERGAIRENLEAAGFLARLRDYQLDGVLWLSSLFDKGLGGILADEMGLGKTVQLLAFIAQKRIGTALIVAPASVVHNWKLEIAKFFPCLPCVIGSLTPESPTSKKGIFILSYQRALRLIGEIRITPFDLVVLDEGQFVKNVETKTAAALRKSVSRMRLVLTGTPIENSVHDLWAHLTFTNESLSDPYRKLSRKFPDFGKSISAAEISAKAFSNLILRRTKQDVELDLPPMVERIIYCEMSKAQRHVYVTTLGAFQKMLGSGIAARVNSIALEALLRLRQCCSFPLLLPKALNPQQVSDSSKLDATFRIVDEDIRNGRKTIIFSQFRMVSDAIENGLTKRGIGVARLDGDSIDRETPVRRFQSDASIRVIVVGFRAGGFGLNLTAAESVILFDPWWNPAAESQAFARAHRIGQKKKVFVSKLICSDTVEDKMLQLVTNKSEIADSLSAISDKMAPADLIELLGMRDLQ